ncbi:MAG TPA: CbiQ family ECF transporter T component, partial [Candidatus Cloacimonas sp.]|nr:CbiQ family ECF transporter T component [Candidatus Cloacimonas sp.]HQO46846.1 CbiQ family ECF transporter T component [Candidatus Cloacimonas sp.]
LSQLKGFVTGLKLRGIDAAKLSLSKRLQVYKQLSITALAELIRSSETAAIALELRGFRSEGKHSILHQQKFSYRDLLCLLIFGALVVLVIRI